ncbi:MAG: ABC transporter ATP-binding protein, partial [Thermoplasmata archaeon]|nr:ABC transporter ATP-binding protein [Thermoplasmata archaeon]
MNYAVETKNLYRVFKRKRKSRKERKLEPEGGKEGKEVLALNDVNIKVKEGELFGLLGPNGAGKTTLIKILATLLLPTKGEAWVAGHNVAEKPFDVRMKINMVSGGETSGYGLLTARENVWMFSQFYGVPSKTAKARADELFEIFGLFDKRNQKMRTLSSGERQKMSMARGFVTDPEIIFLDEPTLGLDVNASRVIRKFISKWVKHNDIKTVLLTTHYMMEADELCDRVAIIDSGKIIACDTPDNLKRLVKRSSTLRLEIDPLKDNSKLRDIPGVRNFSEK